MRFILLICALLSFNSLYAQNPINLKTQTDVDDFLTDVNIISTDADTANIDFKYVGLRVRSVATDNIFEWTGSKWVSGGKTYSVATQAELAELPCPPNNWAYVSSENAWYYCDGSEWVEFNPIDSTTTRNDSTFIYVGGAEYFSGIDLGAVSPSNLTQEGANNLDAIRWNSGTGRYEPSPVNSIEYLTESDTVYVCNDTCQYNTLGKALTAASYFTSVGDTSGTSNTTTTVLIVNNGDGSQAVLNEAINFRGVDLSNVIIGTTDTAIIDATGLNFFELYQSLPPTFKNAVFRRDTINGVYGTTRFYVPTSSTPGLLDNVTFIGFQRPVQAAFSSLDLRNCTIAKSLEIFIIGSYARLFACTFTDNLSKGVAFAQNSTGHLIGCTIDSTNYPQVYDGSRVVFEDCGVIDSISIFDQGEAVLINGTTLTNSPIPINKITKDGWIIDESQSYPFEELTTAQLPSPTSGPRYVYNLDTETTLVLEGGQYQPIDKPDTLVYTFPILPYNATDTIADQIGFEEYFTTITPDWDRRKVVAFEITTTDTVSTDLYLQLYEENIVAGTSAVPIPVTTNFVLPQGQQSVRFTTADTEIPSAGIEFTLGRAVYAAVTNGSAAASTSYVATEGPNGIYITFYLIE